MIAKPGVYIVPAAEPNQWRIGATYNQEDRELGATEKAKAELIEKTQKLITFPLILFTRSMDSDPLRRTVDRSWEDIRQ